MTQLSTAISIDAQQSFEPLDITCGVKLTDDLSRPVDKNQSGIACDSIVGGRLAARLASQPGGPERNRFCCNERDGIRYIAFIPDVLANLCESLVQFLGGIYRFLF